MEKIISFNISFKNKLASLLLLLSNCTVPDLGPEALPREDLIAYKSQSSSQYLYPKQEWWKFYNDPQLNQLIEEGLSQSPSIDNAVARIQKANAQANMAGASLYPSITADGGVSKYRQSYNNGVPPAFVPKGFRNTGKATVNFDYELDFWDKNSDNLVAASSDIEAEKLMLEQAKIILSTSIAAAYANLAQYYAELDVVKETVSVRAQTHKLFEKRFKNGLENESSVEQAKSNHAAAEADLAAIEETIELTHNSLAALIGATPGSALKITRPSLDGINFIGVPTVIPADLISRRPDIMAAQLTLEAAASRINVAKSGFYPNINLTGYIGQQSLGLDTFMKSTSLIGAFGPAIHLPIFDGGLLEGQYRGARANYDSSLANYESAIIQALREVADAITSHRALDLRIKKTTASLRAAERAYQISKNRYEGGLSTYLEVLRVEDSLIASRRAMAQIKARAFILDVALAKALGGGFKPIVKEKIS
jgi:NodT family efflux transporter outer membrane factor (OMF) lipoprotein